MKGWVGGVQPLSRGAAPKGGGAHHENPKMADCNGLSSSGPNPTQLQFLDFRPRLPAAPSREGLGGPTLVKRAGSTREGLSGVQPCQEGRLLQLVKGQEGGRLQVARVQPFAK